MTADPTAPSPSDPTGAIRPDRQPCSRCRQVHDPEAMCAFGKGAAADYDRAPTLAEAAAFGPLDGHAPYSLMDDAATDYEAAHKGVAALLRMLGRDPDLDPGVQDTPARFIRALTEMGTSHTNPADILARTFDGVHYPGDQMIAVGPIPFVSLCEHHLLPFPGTAWVAYVPGDHGRVVGLSKLPRLVDHYAARPQVQERLTTQIADALMKHLEPTGAGVLIRASHGCMTHRGVRKPGTDMVTSVLRGVFLHSTTTRAEFLALTR